MSIKSVAHIDSELRVESDVREVLKVRGTADHILVDLRPSSRSALLVGALLALVLLLLASRH